jgi:hypothetical protein
VLAGAALVVATLPVLGAALLDGGWGTPSRGLSQPLAFVTQERADEAFRIVWIGDPEVLPLSGWVFDDSTTYQVTSTGLPAVRDLFPGEVGGPNAPLEDALDAAADGATARLGAELAPLGVRYVFLPVRKDPGADTDVVPDSPLVEALPEQLDLAELEVSGAVRVWENTAWRAGDGDVPSSASPTGAGTAMFVIACLGWLAALGYSIRTRHRPAGGPGGGPPADVLAPEDRAPDDDVTAAHEGGVIP